MARCVNCGSPDNGCKSRCYHPFCAYCGKKGCFAICEEGQRVIRQEAAARRKAADREEILRRFPINPRVVMLEVVDDDSILLS